ncbi:MAG: GDSL-type esterase/lipase family protein [Chitinophagales bacterium]
MNKLLIISIFFNVVFLFCLVKVVNGLGGVSYLLFKVRGGAGFTGMYEHRKNLFEMLPKSTGEIIFLGDSITAECEWAELFDNEKIKNRGISGDTASGILKRLGSILEAKPDKLFLMVGVNDLIYGNERDLLRNYEQLLQQLTDNLPDTQIIVQSILPINSQVRKMNIENKTILYVNQKIKDLSDKFGLVYADLYAVMADDQQRLKAEYTQDGIHINGSAYLVWKTVVEKWIED